MMKPFQELTPEGKIIRMVTDHLIILAGFFIALYQDFKRLHNLVNSPVPHQCRIECYQWLVLQF